MPRWVQLSLVLHNDRSEQTESILIFEIYFSDSEFVQRSYGIVRKETQGSWTARIVTNWFIEEIVQSY